MAADKERIMPIDWQSGQPASWTLDYPVTFTCHAVINGTEYAIGVEGGFYAVFLSQHGKSERLDNHAFITTQDAQKHAEQHAYR